MITKLKRLTKTEIEQMYYNFFNHCTGCVDFIEFVPKRHLINKILNNVTKNDIKEYLYENF